jgi:choline dehydrogenase
MRSKSRGYIRLQHKEARRHPIINPNYLSAEQDLVEFRDCVRLSRYLFNFA